MDELHCQFHTTASTASPARSRDVSVDITNNLMMQPVVGGKSNVIWLYININKNIIVNVMYIMFMII